MKVRARTDASLAARVVSRRPLFYARGADASLDRPAHVRAGSALARIGEGRLAIVQDDASFLAVVDLASGTAFDVPFPAADGVRLFDDSRGNKKRKLDLEAMIALPDGTVIAFGSGSSDVRDRVLVARGEDVRLVRAEELYAAMRADRTFSGSELNVEGSALDGGDVVFFQRGNGAGDAIDATARVEARALLRHLHGDGPCPVLRDVVAWDLGTATDGVRLTFTDGATTSQGLAFLACAEACPDATRDGPVSGVSIGRLDDRARACAVAEVTDERGAPLVDKAEGLAVAPDGARAWVVIDKDDPSVPSELLELALGDGWRTPIA